LGNKSAPETGIHEVPKSVVPYETVLLWKYLGRRASCFRQNPADHGPTFGRTDTGPIGEEPRVPAFRLRSLKVGRDSGPCGKLDESQQGSRVVPIEIRHYCAGPVAHKQVNAKRLNALQMMK
jgi:hypothetical protein